MLAATTSAGQKNFSKCLFFDRLGSTNNCAHLEQDCYNWKCVASRKIKF